MSDPNTDDPVTEPRQKAQAKEQPKARQEVQPVRQNIPENPTPKAAAGSPDWEPPRERMEYKFEGDVQGAPDWIDKGWAGFDQGPALHVPAGDLFGNGPYVTKTARRGDTIVFLPAEGATQARFDVLKGEARVEEGTGTLKPAQQSGASLEDLVKTGMMQPDQLGEDAKGQVAVRTPRLAKVVSGEQEPPAKPQQAPVTAQSR